MDSALIVYSTVDGHTKKISDYLASVFQEQNVSSTILDIANFSSECFDRHSFVVIGASIRYGKHHPGVYRLVQQHREKLLQKQAAFFSVNLVARKPQKRDPYTNPYTKKFLRQVNWQPAQAAVFAGRLNYPAYRFWDKHLIRLIMWMTKGPTDLGTDMEFTDWQQVKAFASSVMGCSNHETAPGGQV